MCAIFAWFGRVDNDLVKRSLALSEPCGPHSVGFAWVGPNANVSRSAELIGKNVRYHKRAITPKSYQSRYGDVVQHAAEQTHGFFHVRYATHGDKTDENAHPFKYKDHLYCHNGIISNYREIEPAAVVDSEALGPIIQAADVDGDGARAFDLLDGSLGVVWLRDNGKLRFYRRRQSLNCVVVVSGKLRGTYIVVSRLSQLPRELDYIEVPFQTGVRYELGMTGITALDTHVKDAADKPVFARSLDGYRGG
jgi:Glutamine amidotransferase domain